MVAVPFVQRSATQCNGCPPACAPCIILCTRAVTTAVQKKECHHCPHCCTLLCRCRRTIGGPNRCCEKQKEGQASGGWRTRYLGQAAVFLQTAPNIPPEHAQIFCAGAFAANASNTLAALVPSRCALFGATGSAQCCVPRVTTGRPSRVWRSGARPCVDWLVLTAPLTWYSVGW